MKELLLQLSNYNFWANQLLLSSINSLPEDVQQKEVSSSFSSLIKTALHMWDAESIWWQRMKLQERIHIPSASFNGTMQDIYTGLLHQNKQWKEWVQNSQEHQLQHVFQYQNLKGEQFKQPIFEMLLHLFNHNTYHRGQLVNMMRQLGIEKIPGTDFIIWSRRK